jgi:hypothetical protein
MAAGPLTIRSSSANDDNVASGTLTLVSAVANEFAEGEVVLASAVANAFADGTVTCDSVQAGDTVTVNGLVYTAVAGAKADDTEFSVDTSDDDTANDLADSINNDTRTGTLGVVSAVAVTDTVTITTDVEGVAGDAVTLVSSNGTRLAVSGSGTLTGGVDADTVTVNGLVYTAVDGAKADNTQFSIDTSDDDAAADLADSIDNDTRTGTLGGVSATATTDTVTIVTDVEGTDGNAVTLASSNGTRLAVSGAVFSGGVDADVATVNGLTYTAVAGVKADNTEFSIDTDDTAAATDLADSITNDTRTGVTVPGVDVTATSALGVVTIHATTGGPDGDDIDISGTANITASAATLSGQGTGARIIQVDGLDANGVAVRKYYSLNGTVDVVTDEDWTGVNYAQVLTAGSGGTNAGNITIEDGSTNVQSYIAAGVGKSEDAIYIIPTNGYSLIHGMTIGAALVGTASEVKVMLVNVDAAGVKRRVCPPVLMNTNVEGVVSILFKDPLLVQSGHWYIEAGTSIDNLKATVEVDHVLWQN